MDVSVEQEVEIANALGSLLVMQYDGMARLGPELNEASMENFRTAALGAMVELGELVNATHWKPWRKYEAIKSHEVGFILDEWADVLHFILWMTRILSIRYDVMPDEFVAAFITKHKENIARFEGQVPGREAPSRPS